MRNLINSRRRTAQEGGNDDSKPSIACRRNQRALLRRPLENHQIKTTITSVNQSFARQLCGEISVVNNFWRNLAPLMIFLYSQCATAQSFDAAIALGQGVNPAGAWSFGETAGVGGPFKIYTRKITLSNGLIAWLGDNDVSNTPSIYINSQDKAIDQGAQSYGAHSIGFHPGPSDRVSTYRFTAPTNGFHRIEATFFGQDRAPTSTQISILHNGGKIADPFPLVISDFGESKSQRLSRLVNLQKGDTLDVEVSNSGNFGSDSTGLRLMVQGPNTIWDPKLRGFADVHNHQFANLAFGGRMIFGSPGGSLLYAMSASRDATQHGVNHSGEITGALMDGRAGLFLGNNGAPAMDAWPSYRDTDHNKAHKDWLFNAYQGGLRLMVMLAVESPKLCSSVGTDGRDCNDEATSIQAQLRAAVDLQNEIDAGTSGPGSGWYRIVRTPGEARAAITANKLAVVLGVETINSLGVVPNPQYLQLLRNQFGVRHVFPIHQADNFFGGASYFECRLQVQGNSPDPHYNCDPTWLILRTTLINTEGCIYEKYGRCNTLGLTPAGKAFMPELMRAGIIVDADHMSDHAASDWIDIATANGYPVIAGHAGFNEISFNGSSHGTWPFLTGYISAQDHEGQLNKKEYQRILGTGGMVGVMVAAGHDVRDIRTWKRSANTIPHRCGRSSETFAQSYLYGVDNAQGQAVALATDLNTPSLLQPSPRISVNGSESCTGGIDSSFGPDAGPLIYPFKSQFDGQFMDKMASGTRLFDFNTTGLSTIGQLPDLLADLRTLGASVDDLEPIYHSAEAYIKMWEQAEDAARRMNKRAQVFSNPPTLQNDTPQTFTITAKNFYLGDAITEGIVHVNGQQVGTIGNPITMTFQSKVVPEKCEWIPNPNGKPPQIKECTPAHSVPTNALISVSSKGFDDATSLVPGTLP